MRPEYNILPASLEGDCKDRTLKSDADWILYHQLLEHAKGARASAAANLINAAVMGFVFFSALNMPLIAIGLSSMAIVIAHRLWCNAKVPSVFGGGNADLLRIYQHIEWNTWLLGGWWALAIGVPLVSVTSEQQLLVGIIGSGMMGAGTISFRTLERPALTFVGLCAIGSFFALLTIGTTTSYAACILLVCYCAVLFSTIKRAALNFVESKERELALAESTETINLLLNDYEQQGSDWLIEINDLGLIKNPCDRLAAATARPCETLADMRFIDLLDSGASQVEFMRLIDSKEAFRDHIVSLHIGQEQHWWSITARPNHGAQGGHRGVVSDITAQRLAEEKVRYMAHYDSLTGLPNRFLFNERLEYALTHEENGAGLMYLDLDHFKSINDTLGHPIGDKLLNAVALRLEACVRSGDLIARLGGDEFAVLVGGKNLGAIDQLAGRIIDAIGLPFLIDGYEVMTGASIGIAYSPDHGDTPEILLKNADLALYAAKADGRSRFVRFENGMDSTAETRRELELDLRSALARDEMRLHYQPLINVSSGEPSGYEALVRWEHHTRGTVMPGDFIPLAEETGMVIKIGEWVIRRALAEVATWPEHLSVAVNLSPAQMRSTNLLPTIIHALGQSGVAPHRLEFEITESVLMNDSEANIAVLHKLSALGIRIALDDFGTGYSSLNYLRSFPFNKIKIDRCFISEIDSREDCRAIVRSIVSLANSLGIRTTAEGVERQSQLDALRLEGCTEVQGFLFSKAVSSDELSDLRPIAGRRRAA
jgi:diguanylate cyclase (GGDEF)-like protein